jgi:hypothetical protein
MMNIPFPFRIDQTTLGERVCSCDRLGGWAASKVGTVGEAGLGPTEVGSEIAEHARHAGGHADPTRRERLISIVEAGLLAIVALLAAFSGYAAAKWSTESRLTVAEASTARNSSNTADLAALDVRIGDALTFNAWLAANALNDPAAVEVAVRRFRPEFRVAFDAWLGTNPDTRGAPVQRRVEAIGER